MKNQPLAIATAFLLVATAVVAATQGETHAVIENVEPAPAQITQASPSYPSTAPGDEYLDSGTGAATVTYALKLFDRNGEDDLIQAGKDNDQTWSTFLVEVFRPDETGAPSETSLASSDDGITLDDVATDCSPLQVVRTSSEGTGPGGEEPGRAWLLDGLVDATPGNGVLSCDLVLAYNSGQATPPGAYTIKVTAVDALLDVDGTTVRDILLVGLGRSATTTIRQGTALSATIGDDAGLVSFGPVKPGDIDQNQGGILYTPVDDIVIANAGGAQASFGVRFTQYDLELEGALATGAAAIPCDRVAVAKGVEPTPLDAFTPMGAGVCERTMTDLALATSGVMDFQFGLLEPAEPGDNWVLQDGLYRGVLEVVLTGPTGAGGPVGVPGPVVNPVPDFNGDLLQDVDSVGTINATD